MSHKFSSIKIYHLSYKCRETAELFQGQGDEEGKGGGFLAETGESCSMARGRGGSRARDALTCGYV